MGGRGIIGEQWIAGERNVHFILYAEPNWKAKSNIIKVKNQEASEKSQIAKAPTSALREGVLDLE